jgi:glycosyltransferase involved in cell wall biosynthesis
MTGSLHVLHIAGCLGGVETWLRLFVDYADTRMRISMVLPAECELSHCARARGMDVRIVPMARHLSASDDIGACRGLSRVIRELAPDIVHLHSSKAGLLGRLACTGLRQPVIYTPHAYFYLGKRGLARTVFLGAERLLEWWSRQMTLGTSPSEERRAIDDVGCPPSRVKHVLNAVDCDVLDGLRRRAEGGRRRVILVARVGTQKNIPMFLDLVRLLKGRIDAEFCLIGVGHYADDRELLRTMMATAGIDEHDLTVIAWMSRPDLLALIAEAAVVVLTSSYESFGYVLAEANCLGVPVVGTDVDGIRDVIDDGVNGYLVAPGDAASMAERIARLMNDRALWTEMSARAVAEAHARFDIRQASRLFAKIYEEFADARR